MTATIKLIPESYPGAEISAPLGSEVPTPSAGTGIAQYNTIKRPRRRDLMEFAGEAPIQVVFSIILDQWPNGNVVDLHRRIYGWAAKNALPVMPTVLRTQGPIPFSDLRWILTNIEQVEFRARDSDFAACYYELKLTLTEWNDIDLIVQTSTTTPAATASPAADAVQRFQDKYAQSIADNPRLAIAYGKTGITQPRIYIVKKGETLTSIAAHQLGNANRWQEIAAMNNIRDPKRIQINQRLTLPVK